MAFILCLQCVRLCNYEFNIVTSLCFCISLACVTLCPGDAGDAALALRARRHSAAGLCFLVLLLGGPIFPGGLPKPQALWIHHHARMIPPMPQCTASTQTCKRRPLATHGTLCGSLQSHSWGVAASAPSRPFLSGGKGSDAGCRRNWRTEGA